MPPRLLTDRVFVAGFVNRPDHGSSGGFEWSVDRAVIEAIRAEWLARGDSDVSGVLALSLGDLGLDADATREQVTAALNANAEIWEPAEGLEPEGEG